MGFFTGAMGLAYWGARASLGMRAGVGAAIGGVYGAFSDNTSVFGGAVMGAGAGAALGLGRNLFRRRYFGGYFGGLIKGARVSPINRRNFVKGVGSSGRLQELNLIRSLWLRK